MTGGRQLGRQEVRRVRRAATIVALALPAVLLLAPPPATAETAEQVATETEAWYRTPLVGGGEDPACSGPAGCPFQPAAPANPYPENTLHVGATAGRQESATFVTFARTGIPFDAELISGTAILPVASGDAGTVQPETAQIVACLVAEPFEPVQGGPPEEVPEVDCTTTSDAVLEPEADPPHFRVDLTPFISRWTAGTPDNGIGLLVGDGTDGTWHVAFSGREREGDGVAPPITATFTYTTPAGDDTDVPPPAAFGGDAGDASGTADSTGRPASSSGFAAPSFVPDDNAGFVSEPQPDVAPAAPGGAAASEPGPVAAPPVTDAPAQAPAAVTGGYAYPSVWLLPLVLLLGAGMLARVLTDDVAVLDEDASRGLLGRLWLAFFPNRTGTEAGAG